MTMSAFSVCCSVVVLIPHHSATLTRPPPWLRRFTKCYFINGCVKTGTTQKTSVETNHETSQHCGKFTDSGILCNGRNESANFELQEGHRSINNANNAHSNFENVANKLTDNGHMFDRLCNNVQIIVNKINTEEERSAITEE